MKQMNEQPKKQHYVPRFYLRHFSQDGNRVYMFDKEGNGSTKLIGINDVAQEKYFYDLGKPGQRNPILEKTLAKIEAEFALDMVKVLELLEQRIAPDDYMVSLAMLMVITELRTKATRNWVVNMHLDVIRKMIRLPHTRTMMKDQAKLSFPEMTSDEIETLVEELDVESVKDAEPSLHASSVLSSRELLDEASAYLLNRDWYIFCYENDFNYGFWTSDVPVIRYSEKSVPFSYGLGYALPDTDFAFPLSNKYCILLRGEGLLADLKIKKSITLINCRKDLVDYYNSRQCQSALRFIFPCSSNSYLLRHMLKNHPELIKTQLKI